ncbi:uncharacterized protein [Periplaneta americana]
MIPEIFLIPLIACSLIFIVSAENKGSRDAVLSKELNSSTDSNEMEGSYLPYCNETAGFSILEEYNCTRDSSYVYETTQIQQVEYTFACKERVVNSFQVIKVPQSLDESGKSFLEALNYEIRNMSEEANYAACKFISERDDVMGQTLIRKTLEYQKLILNLVNNTNEIKFVNNSSETEEKFSMTGISLEQNLENARNLSTFYKYLCNLINLNSKYQNLSLAINKSKSEYDDGEEVETLESIVEESKNIVEVLDKYVQELKNFPAPNLNNNTIKQFHLTEIRELFDLKMWENELETGKKELEKFEEDLKVERFEIIMRIYISLILKITIFIVGIISNSVLLLVFCRHKEMRTFPNLMIINLTVGDLLSLIANILLFSIFRDIKWTFGLKLCTFYRYIRQVPYGVSVYSVVVISLQRTFVLTNTLQKRGCGCRGRQIVKSVLTILFVWAIASVAAIPYTSNAIVVSNLCRVETSVYFNLWSSTFHLVILCIIPLVIITLSSTISVVRIRKSMRGIKGEAMKQEQLKKSRMLSSKILIALIIVFAVSYLPYFTYLFVYYAISEVEGFTRSVLNHVTYNLIFVNACFNPIALFIASSKYRRFMKNYLCISNRDKINSDLSSGTNTTSVETNL